MNEQSKTIAAGINSDLASLKEGRNENLRIFSYEDGEEGTYVFHSLLALINEREAYWKVDRTVSLMRNENKHYTPSTQITIKYSLLPSSPLYSH